LRTVITNTAKKISTVGSSLRDVQMMAGYSSPFMIQHHIGGDNEAERKVMDLV
jgi:hypothetical protein